MQPEQAIDRSSTPERVADALRSLMFRGDLRAAAALREVAVATQFTVARSTAREALQILAREGLVTRLPNRGAVVRQLSDTDVDDIFHARRILEVAGVRAAGAAGDAARERIRTALRAYELAAADSDEVRASEAHLMFHNSLVGLLESRRLLDTAEALTSDLRLELATVGRIHGDVARQLADHKRLSRLVLRDTDKAAAEVDRHLRKAQEQLHASRRGVGARPAAPDRPEP